MSISQINSDSSFNSGIVEHFTFIGRTYADNPVKSTLLTVGMVAGIALLGVSLFFGLKLYGLSLFSTIELSLNSGLIVAGLCLGPCAVIGSSAVFHKLIKFSAYQTYIGSHKTLDEDSDKPILLILRASNSRDDIVLNIDQRARFKELEKDFQVLFHYIQSPEEMRDHLKLFIENKISVLWYQSHGNAYAMDFGNLANHSLSIDNLSEYSDSINDSLEDGAQIVLESCSIGGAFNIEAAMERTLIHHQTDPLPYPNLAQAFADLTQASILCSTQNLNYKSLLIKSVQPLTIEFYYRYDAGDSPLAKIQNLFYFILYAIPSDFLRYRFFAKNVTWGPDQPTESDLTIEV